VTAFSSDWFPYPVGSESNSIPPNVAARIMSADRLAIRAVPPWLSFGGCSPSTPIVIGGVGAAYCEESYDINQSGEAVYGPKGQLHAIRVLLPLFNVVSDAGQDTTGYRLYVKLVTPTRLSAERHDVLWQLINTLRVYQ
jgi:hypothetical protein